jgi:hypothetical protein
LTTLLARLSALIFSKPRICLVECSREAEKEEDKYGNIVMIGKLYHDYCCQDCSPKGKTQYLEFKDETRKILVCPNCGKETPAPEVK